MTARISEVWRMLMLTVFWLEGAAIMAGLQLLDAVSSAAEQWQ